ncbi:MAG: alpha/beta fold hydrolase [Muribaculaceae bacterium]|nr:alpha/beta fold hydrolase [Muribaculaceae bacterium]
MIRLFTTLIIALFSMSVFAETKGKTLCVFGDSYVRNHRCPQEETWHAKAADRLGMKYVNCGRNGSSVLYDRTDEGFGPAMTERCKALPDTVDCLVIIAGHNDATMIHDDVELAKFRAALSDMFWYLKGRYPDARIGYVTPWHVDRDYFDPVIATIKDVCATYGVPVFDAEKAGGIEVNNPDFRTLYFQNRGVRDTAHLNAAGHDRIVDAGTEFIKELMDSGIFYIGGSEGRLACMLGMPGQLVDGKCPFVILCHGFCGNMQGALFDDISAGLLREGIGVMRFDFNGHGRSDSRLEDMTVVNEIEDLKQVISWLRSQPFTGSISLCGHSQGGVVASMTAGELGYPAIESLALLAPAAVLREDALRGDLMGNRYNPHDIPERIPLPWGGLGIGRRYVEIAQTLPIYETAARYNGPVLLMHGTFDTVVPYTFSERYHHDYDRSELVLIDGEDHGFSKDIAGTAAKVCRFFSLHLESK